MFKPSFWGLVATATLLGACTGEIGGLAGDARFDTDPDIVAELSASDGWRSIEASEPAFETLRFEVMARPEVADIDALVAVGADGITDFSDASIKVRFADDGFIDARDGSTYKSDNAVRYRPGVWYRITISANVADRTYEVAVAGNNELPQTLVTGAAFDSQAGITDHLATWAAWSSQSASLDIAEHTWIASGSCAPSTCLSLGVVCGEPSDGCDGNLTCGSCGSGQTCNSGVCEDVPAPPSPEPPPPPSCEPANCVSLGMECGDWGDGCGGQLSCGGCGSGQTCTSGVCEDVMPPSPPPCEPATCTSWGVECGRWSDGCGGELRCGGCGSERSCTSGVCVDVQPPPPPPCQPATCLSLGKECGSWNDGGDGTLSCGGCTGSDLCSAAGSCYDPNPCIPDCSGKECGSDGCGGSCGTCSGTGGSGDEPELFWASTEQTTGKPWGFSDVVCEKPHDNRVSCSDANGVNASKVANPIAGGGFAIRQYGELNGPGEGARSEPGIHTQDFPVWEAATTSGTQFYLAQELYFPSDIVGTGEYPWLSIMDFHSVNVIGQNRYHTNPGFFIQNELDNPPGNMYIGVAWANNNSGGVFSQPLPVGEWFDLEVSYRWTTSKNSTLQAWINGTLVYTENNVQTANSSQSVLEWYSKLYGDDNDDSGPDGNWAQDPTIFYRRNIRASFSPLTH